MRLQGTPDRGRWLAIAAVLLLIVVGVLAYFYFLTPTL
jgi:hypothetical protein